MTQHGTGLNNGNCTLEYKFARSATWRNFSLNSKHIQHGCTSVVCRCNRFYAHFTQCISGVLAFCGSDHSFSGCSETAFLSLVNKIGDGHFGLHKDLHKLMQSNSSQPFFCKTTEVLSTTWNYIFTNFFFSHKKLVCRNFLFAKHHFLIFHIFCYLDLVLPCFIWSSSNIYEEGGGRLIERFSCILLLEIKM